jgi:hypothetical protein
LDILVCGLRNLQIDGGKPAAAGTLMARQRPLSEPISADAVDRVEGSGCPISGGAASFEAAPICAPSAHEPAQVLIYRLFSQFGLLSETARELPSN